MELDNEAGITGILRMNTCGCGRTPCLFVMNSPGPCWQDGGLAWRSDDTGMSIPISVFVLFCFLYQAALCCTTNR